MPRRRPADDPRFAAPDFPHGAPAGYDRGCPCAECRTANAERMRLRREAECVPKLVPAGPVAAHIDKLLVHGCLNNIARAAGVPFHTLRSLQNTLTPERTVHIKTAEPILALGPAEVLAAKDAHYVSEHLVQTREYVFNLLAVDHCTVPEIAQVAGLAEETVQDLLADRRRWIRTTTIQALTGVTAEECYRISGVTSSRQAATRLRALQANQWPLETLTEMLGHDATKIIDSSRVTIEVDEDVATLYDRLRQTMGVDEPAGDAAFALGFYPPEHYDDDMQLIPERVPQRITDEDQARRDRARLWFRIIGYTLRGYSENMMVRNLRISSGVVQSTRRKVGLRLTVSRGLDDDLLEPGQDDLVALFQEYLRPIVISEPTDVLDEENLDHDAHWKSLALDIKALQAEVHLDQHVDLVDAA